MSESKIAKTTSSGFDIAIKLSDDYYQAFLTIIETKNSSGFVTKDEIMQALANRNIVFGIKEDIIDLVVKDGNEVSNILVADGIKHCHGDNASIEYHFKSDRKVKPKILDDGSVDFKDMSYIELIKEGDILATKTFKTKGKNGTTVTGKTIKGKDGKDLALKAGKNVGLSRDEKHLIAETDGITKMEHGRISILKLLEIRNDIGIETGNIEFSGDVHIYGNVLSGFSVKADGDIVINGVVEGATVISKGDLTITRGIQGNDTAYIESAGNITTNFVNSATIKCYGNLETSSLIHSLIKCDGDVTVQAKKGIIVGGEVVAARNIFAKVLGSELGIITVIKLGIDVDIIEEFRELNQEVKGIKENMDKLDKAIKLLNEKVHNNPANSANVSKLVSYKELREKTRIEFDEKKKRLIMLNQLINNLKNSKIQAKKIYPGTKVKIGSSAFSAKDQLNNVEVKKLNGEIRVISLV